MPNLASYNLEPIAPKVIDSSMLSTYVDCPSLFYLRYVLGLRPKRPQSEVIENDYFGWGGTWHMAQEILANEGLVPAVKWLEENFPVHIAPATDRYNRGKERMIRALFDYYKLHKEEDANWEILRTEQFFHVFLEEYGFEWCGRIDQIRRNRKSGEKVIWDFKTSSRMGPTYFPGLKRSFQFLGYVVAGNEFSTEPISKICADVFYCISQKEEFFRQFFTYTPQERNEWLANTKKWLAELSFMLTNHLEDPEAWKKNYNECARYGKCGFYDVHDTPPIGDQRLKILQHHYEVERWDPMAHIETTSIPIVKEK